MGFALRWGPLRARAPIQVLTLQYTFLDLLKWTNHALPGLTENLERGPRTRALSVTVAFRSLGDHHIAMETRYQVDSSRVYKSWYPRSCIVFVVGPNKHDCSCRTRLLSRINYTQIIYIYIYWGEQYVTLMMTLEFGPLFCVTRNVLC